MPGEGRKEGVGAPEPGYRGCPAAILRTRSRLFGPNQPSPAYSPFTIGQTNQIGFPLGHRKRKWGILATKVVPAHVAASNRRNEQGFEPMRTGSGEVAKVALSGGTVKAQSWVLGAVRDVTKGRLVELYLRGFPCEEGRLSLLASYDLPSCSGSVLGTRALVWLRNF